MRQCEDFQESELTDHKLRMHVDHEPAVILSRFVVAALLWALSGLVLSLRLGLSVGKAEEGEIISGALVINALCTKRGSNFSVHHLHGLLLPIQDGLHGSTLGDTFRPHGYHNVHCESLAVFNLTDNLPCQLHGDEVNRTSILVLLPVERASQEVLILDVDEVLGTSNCVDVRILDTAVDGVVLSAS